MLLAIERYTLQRLGKVGDSVELYVVIRLNVQVGVGDC